MKDTLKKFLVNLGLDVLGFVIARVLDGIPVDKRKDVGGIAGDFFQAKVTPFIGESNEQRVQVIVWDIVQGFNERVDLVEA